MYKKLAYLALLVAAVATATVVACNNDTSSGPKDFATNTDGGGPSGDMGSDMNTTSMYAAATPHDIDTNTIGGMFGKGTAVALTGMIVISPISGFSANSDKDCKYEVWVQDPTCSTPPCGLVIETAGITNPGGTGSFCSFSYSSMTALNGVKKGDKLDIKGVVNTFASSATPPATGTVVQHEVDIDMLTVTATGQTVPAATVVTDADPSLFVPYSGTGWAMYEGMIVKLQPASGKFTTTLDTYGGWTCAPGGGHFADTFTTFFRPDGAAANMWPPNGSMFSSISGIVSLTFGGGILPDDNSDFVP